MCECLTILKSIAPPLHASMYECMCTQYKCFVLVGRPQVYRYIHKYLSISNNNISLSHRHRHLAIIINTIIPGNNNWYYNNSYIFILFIIIIMLCIIIIIFIIMFNVVALFTININIIYCLLLTILLY